MKETELQIRVLGEPVLLKQAKPINKITEYHRGLLSKMSRLMYAASGVGLAAPQVGVSEALIVADIGTGLYKLINPKITKKEGVQVIEEGCLSVPGITMKIKRAKRVTVNALDDTGKSVIIEAEDLLSCVLQHEIDHLNGKLIIEYASWLDKIKMKKTLSAGKKGLKDEGLRKPKTEPKTL